MLGGTEQQFIGPVESYGEASIGTRCSAAAVAASAAAAGGGYVFGSAVQVFAVAAAHVDDGRVEGQGLYEGLHAGPGTVSVKTLQISFSCCFIISTYRHPYLHISRFYLLSALLRSYYLLYIFVYILAQLSIYSFIYY